MLADPRSAQWADLRAQVTGVLLNQCWEAAYFQILLFASALVDVGSDSPMKLMPSLRGRECAAPQGLIRIDPDNNHAGVYPRIGRSMADGNLRSFANRSVRSGPIPTWCRTQFPRSEESLRGAIQGGISRMMHCIKAASRRCGGDTGQSSVARSTGITRLTGLRSESVAEARCSDARARITQQHLETAWR
ncbi:MAG: transporter substrate-binding protein [Burkholderiaceae bacterium]|nr:transporter substrate-binding protein [Burkholderiaceae bacterium]